MKRFAACVVVALSVTSIALAQPPAKEAPTAMLSVVVTGLARQARFVADER